MGGAEGTGAACRSVPAQGLGYLAAALLGHAHPDDLLRAVRHCAGALRAVAGRASEGLEFYRPGRFAAGASAGVRERDLPAMRRRGPARNRHHGYVCGLVMVLLSLLRSEK